MNDLDKAYNKYVNNHITVQNDILTLNDEAVTDYCEIDSNLRNITIPEGYKTAGVMADNNVKKIYFKINKFSQETDLSQLDIYINYQNGNNEADRYKVLDKQIEGDYIIFSWLISSFATKYKGTIKFIICMNNENNIHWNSTLATLNVLEGLETDEAIADQNPDTIEEILKRLNDLEENGDTGDIDINSQKATFEIAETRENIKTGETIATIFGKIKKYFTDLKTVAFTGSYNDLSNKPDIPEAYTLPQANENQLGGIKAKAKTTEDNEVAISSDGKLYANSVSQEQVNTAINGLLEDGSLANMTIKDDSIEVKKLKGLEYEYQGGLNQINPDDFTDGYRLDSSTGELISNEGYRVSNTMAIGDSKYYLARSTDWDGNTYVVFYGADDEFISSVRYGQNSNGIYGEIPTGASYAKACYKIAYTPLIIFDKSEIDSNIYWSSLVYRYINNPFGDTYTNYIQKYFKDQSISLKAINGVGAKMYNLFSNVKDETANEVIIPIKEKYYIYNLSNTKIPNGSYQFKALCKNKEVKLLSQSYIDSMAYREVTLTDIDNVVYVIFTNVSLTEDQLSNLMISERNDLEEYHSYGEYYFEPTNEVKKFVQSAQQDIVKQYNGGVMLTIGDSYTAYMNSVFSDFAEKHGLVQDNRGVASSTIAGDLSGSVGYQPFWNRIDTVISEYTTGHSINEVTYNLEDVKLITFMGGANDWDTVNEATNRLGNGVNTTDKNTLYGALNYCFNALLKNFPNADIVCILQPTNYVNTVPTTEDAAKNVGFESLAQVQVMDDAQYSVYKMQRKERIVRTMAEQYSIPVCDCCFEWFNPCNPNDAEKYWSSDKLHLNADGHHAIIDKLEKTVNNLPFNRN